MQRSKLSRAAFLTFLAFGVPFLSLGCAPYQYSQFRGAVTRGIEKASPATHELGGQFGRTVEGVPDGLVGFSLGQAGGTVVFVFDKAKVNDEEGRLSNGTIRSIYYAANDPFGDDLWADFLRKDDAGRERSAGVQRLQGDFDVEKWNSIVDFRIRLDMRGTGEDPVRVHGVVTTFDRWECHPTEWFAWTGYLMGFGGSSKPAKGTGT